MKGLTTFLSALLTLAHQVSANVDHVSLYASNGATIVEADATLVLPSTPNPISGDVALWSAIQLNSDFLQGVSENAPAGLGYCTNLGSNWCNFAYALTPSAENGKTVIAAPGARVRTHYKLNSSTNLWDQNLYVNDELVSTISTSQGQKGEIFYISVECAAGSCAAAPAHSWEDVSIVLSAANPNFKHSGSWNFGATGGEMSTSDNGITWKFTTLNVPATTD
ncbi:hypothetical protein NPX13_g4732 [Xylaria arbuscula]|uniref:Uncharacterized protein n=1 Tax=Xylaria arbuscula TaxID=114810 RepID=A0A9W8NEZ4_9PEZI|nr:hypothetical protein NPX13_g4732 [Xylaria arbuscula]